MSNVVALIPARSGSKRLPQKNHALLGSRSLLSITMDRIRESGIINRSVISTDSNPLIQEASAFDDLEVLRRPPALAADDTRSEDVIEHAIRMNGLHESLIVLLQLTSPLRSTDDVRSTIEKVTCQGYRSAVSVTSWRIPPSPPYGDVDVTEKRGAPKTEPWPGPLLWDGQSWAINGAIYVFSAAEFLKTGKLHDAESGIHPMPSWRSIDIDYPDDLELANKIVTHPPEI